MIRSYKWTSPIVEGYQISGACTADVFRSTLSYKLRDDDIFVVSYPKCGTTWTIYTLTLIFRQGEPLGEDFNVLELGPFLEMVGPEGIEQMQRPGVIKTHLPFRLAPWSATAKYIHVARNPKDACVSLFYHMRDTPWHDYDGTFDDFFEDYMSGEMEFGGYFDHLMGWYERRNDPNVLFMTYEEMKENPEAAILKMASFLDDEKYAEPLRKDPQKLRNVIKYSSYKEMKATFSKNYEKVFTMSLEDLKSSQFPEGKTAMFSSYHEKHMLKHGPTVLKTTYLIRKGIIGDWRGHFSEEQSRRMDEKFAERMKNTEIANLFKEYM